MGGGGFVVSLSFVRELLIYFGGKGERRFFICLILIYILLLEDLG